VSRIAVSRIAVSRIVVSRIVVSARKNAPGGWELGRGKSERVAVGEREGNPGSNERAASTGGAASLNAEQGAYGRKPAECMQAAYADVRFLML
jgi:hypothetical protein